MSPLLVFVLIFSISCFTQLHIKAGKRIRALEKETAELNQHTSDILDYAIELAEMINTLAERSADDGKELTNIHTNLLKLREKS